MRLSGKGLAGALWWGARGALPYAVLVVQRHLDCLYILQLERYKPDRYAGWLRGHWRLLLGPSEVAVQIALAALATMLPDGRLHWLPAYGLWVVSGHVLLARRTPLQMSQRLQWTARATRLSGTAFALSGLVLLVVAWVYPSSPDSLARVVAGMMGGCAAVGLLAPYTVLAAGRLIAPVEQSIYRRLLREADGRMRGYPGRVVGITGSYGKTTTKFIATALLEPRFRVLKTPDGVNTTMGITRVIREELRDDHDVFVVEVAAYGPGEIREVCDILRPRLGILTAVGVQHLERFGSQTRIAEAKYELLAALPRGGPAIVNADDPVCLELARRACSDGKRLLLYGAGEDDRDLAVRGVGVKVGARGTSFQVVARGGDTASFETRLVGRWNLSNVLAGITAALELGVPLAVLREPVAALRPAPRRLEVREEGGIVKILDVANANPLGAEMALEVLGQFEGGSRILITPGLVELGPIQAEENRRLGQRAAAVCDYVVLVGTEQTRPIREGLLERGFPTERLLGARHADEVADRLAGIVRPGDILLYENRLPDTYLEAG